MGNVFKNPWFLAGMLVASIGVAGSIKSWSAGEPLTAGQLNANFSHIHSSMVGNGHSLLVNADVSGTANIASSKLNQGAGMVDAMVRVGSRTTPCTTATCTMYASVGVSSVTRTSTGVYVVNFSPAISDNSVLIVGNAQMVAAPFFRWCFVEMPYGGVLNSVGVACLDSAAAASDTAFSLIALNGTAP